MLAVDCRVTAYPVRRSLPGKTFFTFRTSRHTPPFEPTYFCAASPKHGAPPTLPPPLLFSVRWFTGFCLVCFAAVAAFHALESLGCGRVAMLDFDVHHGNGVAALVKGEERVRSCCHGDT